MVHRHVVVVLAEKRANCVEGIQHILRACCFLWLLRSLLIGIARLAHATDDGFISHFLVHDDAFVRVNELMDAEAIGNLVCHGMSASKDWSQLLKMARVIHDFKFAV